MEQERAVYYNRYVALYQENLQLKSNQRVGTPTFTRDTHPKVSQSQYSNRGSYEQGVTMTASVLD